MNYMNEPMRQNAGRDLYQFREIKWTCPETIYSSAVVDFSQHQEWRVHSRPVRSTACGYRGAYKSVCESAETAVHGVFYSH